MSTIDPIEPTFTTTLEELVDIDTLGEVFENFLQIFNVPLRLFNNNGDLVLERTVENPACEHLNTQPGTRGQCLVIRQRVKMLNPKQEGLAPVTVPCFCGFEYQVFPIVFQSKLLGKLAIGPYFPKHLERIPGEVMKIEPRLATEPLRDAYSRLHRYSAERMLRFGLTVRATLDCIFFAVHKSNVTSDMHMAMVRESYREIADKNRRLEEIAEERREFDRRKSNFLAMVSHELRTPLTSIIGYSDMLTEGIAGELADEQRQFIGTIKNKGDELLKVISSILDFSQIDAGRLDVNPAPSHVEDLIEAALKRNREVAARRGVKISVHVPAGMPTVQMDPEKMVTAVSHLVDNAIKFSAPGALVKITSRIVASDESDTEEDGFGFVLMASPDMLEISVEDFGIGIDTDDVESLFAPFVQADQSSTREHGGAGMGLAIVKHYVEAHGGRIHVQSRKGEGSNFTVRIPILDQPH